MRFDTLASFVHVGDEYNADTGNTDSAEVQRTNVYANVTETPADFARINFGKVKTDSLTVIVPGRIPHEFDHVLIEGYAGQFKVDKQRNQRRTSTFFVSGG